MNYWCVFPPYGVRPFFWAVDAMPRLYQPQPLHDGRNKKKIGLESGNRDRLSQGSEQIENVYTADATPSQLAPGASGSDTGGKGVFLLSLMVQRSQS